MARSTPVLISACLLGVRCRYDGGAQPQAGLQRLSALAALIPVCPEQLGGLPTPRAPSERRGDGVCDISGADVTGAFRRGAGETCRIAALSGARLALLKARSPSCGSREVYDGSFSGRLVPGSGVAAQALRDMGVRVFDETEIEALVRELESDRN